MSVQKSGLKYLTSYCGALKIAEEILNIATFIAASICGYQLKTYTIIFISIYSFLCTGIFILLHMKSLMLKMDLPWYWIECLNCVVGALIYTLAASIALSELTKGFILTGIFGYLAAMVYILDMIDKFKLAVTPRAQYVWTTPNMPV